MIGTFSGEHRFLSNFWPCHVWWQGFDYPSAEHAYQASKTVLPEEYVPIRTCVSASAAKRLGRHVTLRPGWGEMRLTVMEGILRAKFSDPVLGGRLLLTREEELVEGNYWRDYFWGVCNGVGENHLGKLLMKIRGELRS